MFMKVGKFFYVWKAYFYLKVFKLKFILVFVGSGVKLYSFVD